MLKTERVHNLLLICKQNGLPIIFLEIPSRPLFLITGVKQATRHEIMKLIYVEFMWNGTSTNAFNFTKKKVGKMNVAACVYVK